jgi:PKD repeat protein
VASFRATPAAAGHATSFDASASTARGAPIATYAWNFGDGTRATTTIPTTTHRYPNAGTYHASLTLTDADGTSTTKVFTGQTTSRNGGLPAHAMHTINVP